MPFPLGNRMVNAYRQASDILVSLPAVAERIKANAERWDGSEPNLHDLVKCGMPRRRAAKLHGIAGDKVFAKEIHGLVDRFPEVPSVDLMRNLWMRLTIVVKDVVLGKGRSPAASEETTFQASTCTACEGERESRDVTALPSRLSR